MLETIAKAEELTRLFAEQRAVDGMSFDVDESTIYGLVGPNGSGKTTLLHLIAGLLEPTAGGVTICGVSPRSATFDPSTIAYVSDRGEPPRLTRLSQLAELQQAACSRFNPRVFRDLLEERRINSTQTWFELSKGQRRWVLVALAIASQPRLLLMDEPTDGLDVEGKSAMAGHIRDLVTNVGTAAIISSHILGDLQRNADHLLLISAGKVLLNESIDVLRDEVRELTVPPVLDAWTHDDHVSTLTRQSTPDGETLWIRSNDATVFDRIAAEPLLSLGPLRFEPLYLALVDGAGDTRPTNPSSDHHLTAQSASEESTC